jgi:ABC-type oligopeptide transport system substrate-binding subunit
MTTRRWRGVGWTGAAWLGLVAAAVATVLAHTSAGASTPEGGIFRVGFARFDYVDPALASSTDSRAILDTTCARLLT